jgi:Xaa-Pro aminopeptidase
MSGTRSADAHGSYAMSAGKRIAAGELVLVHCNSYADGFWTDVTRTFSVGRPDDRHRRMYDAVAEARAAAIAAIKPGVTGREVDRAARDVLRRRGFGDEFKHPTGHGVGFAAIDHNAMPRLHPASDDVLEVGSVFNIEPAIYRDEYDGMRHCDVVALGEDGATVLTPFQCEVHDLLLRA